MSNKVIDIRDDNLSIMSMCTDTSVKVAESVDKDNDSKLKYANYRLQWPAICCDIIYERFWSKGLTFWMLYIGSLQLFTLLMSQVLGSLDFTGRFGKMLSSTVTFLFYGIYGLLVLLALLPFMFCNGKNTSNSSVRKVILSAFPVLFGVGQYYLWEQALDVQNGGSNLLIGFIFITLAAYFLFYVWSLIKNNKYSHFDLKISKDIKHVRQLLKLNISEVHKSNELFRYSMGISHTKRSERSIGEFFQQVKLQQLCSEIYHDTPGLLWLSFFSGLTFAVYIIILIIYTFYLYLSYNDFLKTFTFNTGLFVITLTFVSESGFYLLRDSWNTSLTVAVSLAGLLATFSLIWPIVVSINTRYNLQTGLWRHNKHAYISSYKDYTIVNIPGNQICIVVVGIIIYTFVLQLFLFTFIYPPVYQFFWVSTFGWLVVGINIGVIIKTILVYLIFDCCLKCTNNPHFYSIGITVMFLINFLYGIINAILRLGYYIAYSFFALFRYDVSTLPPLLWSMDSSFCAFNAFLLYQVY